MLKTASKLVDPRTFDSLAAAGWISRADLDAAADEALTGPTEMESLLIGKYRVPEAILRGCLSDFYGCPAVAYDERIAIDPELLRHLNMDYLKTNHWIPFRRDPNSVDVLIDDPHDLDKCLDITRAFPGVVIRFRIALRLDIRRFLLKALRNAPRGSISDVLRDLVREGRHVQQEYDSSGIVHENHNTIVRLATQVIEDAYRLGASDIHIEPYSGKKDTIIRLRVDGSCFPYAKIPSTCRRAMVSRFKIMANLDIAERRKPQDGKIKFLFGGEQEVELRVATVPTAGNNEDVVLRIVTGMGPLLLDAMDLSAQSLRELKGIVEKPYGIILCVGPTGSGKTTTLHALLRTINTQERKIWTAEDPIEITEQGLRQVQVQPKIGFTFAMAMRAFLRADPDVIMIGEMRDKETADIALEASLTGHLVLSTLHTNSAVETVTRLLDLGCDAFNFADAMLGILAKRLCKRLCDECKEDYRPSKEEYDELVDGYGPAYWKKLGLEYDHSFRLFVGRGCNLCNHTGFKGRIALYELLLGTERMRTLIQSNAKTGTLIQAAIEAGMTTLVQDGIHKALQGRTTYKQVRRVAIK